MNKLLLVDGSNIVMRAAFGGDIEPERAVQIATGLIQRAIRQSEASHMVIAMDSDAPSWRKTEYPQYKADRTLDTSPWLHAAQAAWLHSGYYVEEWGGFEADDILATIAHRVFDASSNRVETVVVSNDSDILVLADLGAKILRPVNGGTFEFWNASDVARHFNLRFAGQLTDYKAMCGEKGDNIPGVPGVGPTRASALLRSHDNLSEIISWGATEGACKYSRQVYECRETVLTAQRLITLRKDVPIPPIKPANCKIK